MSNESWGSIRYYKIGDQFEATENPRRMAERIAKHCGGIDKISSISIKEVNNGTPTKVEAQEGSKYSMNALINAIKEAIGKKDGELTITTQSGDTKTITMVEQSKMEKHMKGKIDEATNEIIGEWQPNPKSKTERKAGEPENVRSG